MYAPFHSGLVRLVFSAYQRFNLGSSCSYYVFLSRAFGLKTIFYYFIQDISMGELQNDPNINCHV